METTMNILEYQSSHIDKLYNVYSDIPFALRMGHMLDRQEQKDWKRLSKISRVRLLWIAHFGHQCQSCNCDMDISTPDSPNSATVDHVLARSLGGDNNDGNLMVVCKKCNNGKSAHESRHVLVMKQSIVEYHTQWRIRRWLYDGHKIHGRKRFNGQKSTVDQKLTNELNKQRRLASI